MIAGTGGGVLVSRLGLASLARGEEMRLACSGPAGPEVAALLGCDLFGWRTVPVIEPDPASAWAAALDGRVDAVFLPGLARLMGTGLRPVFTLGAFGEAGSTVRDPALPDVPHLGELLAGSRARPAGFRPPSFRAWQAVAAAAMLEFGLMLPQLTPASRVAIWRRAGRQALAEPEVQAALEADGLNPFAPPAASALTARIATTAPDLLDYRRWLAVRFEWQPS